MNKMRLLLVGALCASFIILGTSITVTAQAANPQYEVLYQDENGKWLGADQVEVRVDDLTKINTSPLTAYSYFEMWHYSGAYWGVGAYASILRINDRDIEDNYINFNNLIKSQKVTFEFPIPDEVKLAVENGQLVQCVN